MRNANSQQLAKSLRKHPTEAEQKLWHHLRGGQLNSHKFRRQAPIGPYIADFACLEARVIIEVDGGQHFESDHDAQRDRWFRTNDWRLLRFWNNQVLGETDGVIEVLLAALNRPHPGLPPSTGEGDQRKLQ